MLFYAANLWRISESALPPSLQDVLYRDREWDSQVSIVFQTIKYFLDAKKNPANANDPKTHKGIV